MLSIISLDSFDAPNRFRKIAETKQAGIVGQEAAGPGVFNDGRLAAREVTEASIADPGVLQPDARRFDATELAE
jgi:hypothetical protein